MLMTPHVSCHWRQLPPLPTNWYQLPPPEELPPRHADHAPRQQGAQAHDEPGVQHFLHVHVSVLVEGWGGVGLSVGVILSDWQARDRSGVQHLLHVQGTLFSGRGRGAQIFCFGWCCLVSSCLVGRPMTSPVYSISFMPMSLFSGRGQGGEVVGVG